MLFSDFLDYSQLLWTSFM
ncbi:hypothetical protein WG66_014889, partial [Moniliophthora roreri]